ncbi:hypothetical protein M3Y94_00799700 [Aphelenchoides besseyi]|nr:hypothetical protein M3Y94_00799700 [Aphelenchoides besseyi]
MIFDLCSPLIGILFATLSFLLVQCKSKKKKLKTKTPPVVEPIVAAPKPQKQEALTASKRCNSKAALLSDDRDLRSMNAKTKGPSVLATAQTHPAGLKTAMSGAPVSMTAAGVTPMAGGGLPPKSDFVDQEQEPTPNQNKTPAVSKLDTAKP